MERPYVFMQRALLTFKAAGLHPPLSGFAEEDFWLRLWVERYGALEPQLFNRCVKRLAGERYFPRLHDMDAAVLDEQKKRQLARRRTQERRTDCPEPDLFDLVNSQRRVREIIEHLQNRLLPVYK
ncbi:MAG: hypothetical protein Q4E98_08845 [Acidaminococcaceae bacterium]|nr:hypothetical protein [Acidaminococcaceae bacterium]